MKHTWVVSTKCTPGFACRAFSDTTLVCFIVNEHSTKCSHYINVYMILHLTSYPMMSLWSSTSMVTIQGVPKIWIYMYQDVQKNFVNVVSYIKAVCCGMACPISWKNPAHLMYLKQLSCHHWLRNFWVYMGVFICRITLFNPSHISIMLLHFTEAPMYILNHDVCTLLSGFCTKGFCFIF